MWKDFVFSRDLSDDTSMSYKIDIDTRTACDCRRAELYFYCCHNCTFLMLLSIIYKSNGCKYQNYQYGMYDSQFDQYIGMIQFLVSKNDRSKEYGKEYQ